MAIPPTLRNLVGEWEGTSDLWRDWLTPAHSESPTRATVTSEAGGAALAIRYDWTLERERHEGLLLIGGDGETISAAWTDSWHSSTSLLVMTGGADQGGSTSVTGTYGAEPDLWGWRTELRVEGDANLELVMFNITPAGEESMAVRKRYSRLSPPQGVG